MITLFQNQSNWYNQKADEIRNKRLEINMELLFISIDRSHLTALRMPQNETDAFLLAAKIISQAFELRNLAIDYKQLKNGTQYKPGGIHMNDSGPSLNPIQNEFIYTKKP